MNLLALLKRIEFRGDGFECPECSRLGRRLDAGVHAQGCELKATIDEIEGAKSVRGVASYTIPFISKLSRPGVSGMPPQPVAICRACGATRDIHPGMILPAEFPCRNCGRIMMITPEDGRA